nr:MAG TPA: hypothetical protein [Caudoviricetes sp.]
MGFAILSEKYKCERFKIRLKLKRLLNRCST